jgi:hypothetical protein
MNFKEEKIDIRVLGKAQDQRKMRSRANRGDGLRAIALVQKVHKQGRLDRDR